MAARGSVAKEKLTKQILEMFSGSFMDDKVIRVPMDDGGEIVEIKLALTCAKDILGGGVASEVASKIEPAAPVSDTPTESEKASIKKLFDNWKL